MKKEKTLTFKDLNRAQEPKTERLSEGDMLRKQLQQLRHENQALREEHAELIASFRLLSHDLRAPVRAISQLSEWIFEDCKGKLPGDAEENLIMMHARARRLDTMHHDLNEYVRCEELFDEHPSTFNLTSIVSKIWQEQSSQLSDGQHFEFAMDIDEFAEWPTGHPRVIERIVECVTANAIAHHDRNEGFISVTARVDHERFRLCVDDDGPGIALHLHDQALAPMKTLRARDKGAGTGLGLAMVDRLVHLASGKIQLQYTFSTTSRGLRVVCDFPIHPRAEA